MELCLLVHYEKILSETKIKPMKTKVIYFKVTFPLGKYNTENIERMCV